MPRNPDITNHSHHLFRFQIHHHEVVLLKPSPRSVLIESMPRGAIAEADMESCHVTCSHGDEVQTNCFQVNKLEQAVTTGSITSRDIATDLCDSLATMWRH